ncbi:Nidogen-2 [Aphelenchoides bicaudatus]|nr:Nidogen-2 [Aphelenchoides bicaudatus]
MEPNTGMCSGKESSGQIWYFFNSATGMCEHFLYYGCAAGNQNRFYSLYQCKQVCGERFDPQIACERCDIRTSICTAISKYSYVCECRKGYLKTEQGECIDMDECDLMQAECHEKARCVNTIGSYRCECGENYIGDGKTECKYVGPMMVVNVDLFKLTSISCLLLNIDECASANWPCDTNSQCINTPGSFYCECLPGFAGNGRKCSTSPMSCLDRFDEKYKEPCMKGQEWHVHYYLDHSSKKCSMFWYDGCITESSSMNIFSQLYTCDEMCVKTNVLAKSDRCWDKFDPALRNSCSRGNWEQRYFFDHSSMTCQLFWFDGCKTSSRNVFEDLLTCQWLCEEEPRYKTRACLEAFDEHYRDECNGGLWRQNYYFDKQKMRCVAFWYDGCVGISANLFPDYSSCLQTCEAPVEEIEALTQAEKYHPFTHAPTQPHTQHPHRHHIQRPTKDRQPVTYSPKFLDRPNAKIYEGKVESNNQNGTVKSKAPRLPSENICEESSPCQNNSTCVYDKLKKTYRCECVDGFIGRNCTDFNDRDPCAKHPCKNGGDLAQISQAKTNFRLHLIVFACPDLEELLVTKNLVILILATTTEPVELQKAHLRFSVNAILNKNGAVQLVLFLFQTRICESSARMLNLCPAAKTNGMSNYTEPDGDLYSLNGTKKQLMKSQTLRLPAGSTESASCPTYSQPLLFSLFLFISSQFLIA